MQAKQHIIWTKTARKLPLFGGAAQTDLRACLEAKKQGGFFRLSPLRIDAQMRNLSRYRSSLYPLCFYKHRTILLLSLLFYFIRKGRIHPSWILFF